MTGRSIIEVRNLVKTYRVGSRAGGRSTLRAVDDVSFDLREGEALGLIGESGSGKSTTARCLMRLIEPTSGEVRFEGQDVLASRGRALKAYRQSVQMVFQDPYSSLDPSMRVSEIIGEGMEIHGIGRSAKDRRDKVAELLHTVGLRPDHLDRRPQRFSGGERQRIGIARALAVEPRVLICDEPVASLDLSIQAQILNLFKKLQLDLSLTILYIAHDLATVRFLCDRVAVMKSGKIVELGDREQIYEDPKHPYSKELLEVARLADHIE